MSGSVQVSIRGQSSAGSERRPGRDPERASRLTPRWPSRSTSSPWGSTSPTATSSVPGRREAVVVDPGWPGDSEIDGPSPARAARDPRHARRLRPPRAASPSSPRDRRARVHGRGRARAPRAARRLPPAGVAHPRPYTPEVLLEGDETLELAGIEFQTLRVPGHTPAHLAYARGRLRSSPATSSLPARSAATTCPGGDWEALLASIRMLVEACRPRRSSTRATARRRRSATSSRRTRSWPSSGRSRREDRGAARHPRHPSGRPAALAAVSTASERPRALRLPADRDAGLRGHGAVRADVRRGLGRRPEGDVHVR